MEFLKASTLSLLLIFTLTITTTTTSMASILPSLHCPMKGAYWPSWSENFPPSAIDTTLFTHIYYAFLSPNNITFKIDVDEATAPLLNNFTATLRSKNPPVKALFSIGGAGDGPAVFSQMASDHESRKNFILSTIQVARKFKFDGVDLDWEFPETPEDMINFRQLLYQWRAAVRKEAKATGRPQLLLSAATYFSSDFFLSDVYRKYPVAAINENLDWINAMCYDYHGSWDTSATGSQAALYDPNSNISTSYGLHSWLRANIRREKLVMGLPLYGRTWRLKDQSLVGIGAPAVDIGPGILGQLSYSEIVNFNAVNNATVVFDLTTVSVYSVAGTAWIGYDDVRSVTIKVAYAQKLRLGGYFFWAVNGDHDWQISQGASDAWIL